MMRRCGDPTRPEYRRYGGRGITVCERWHSFAAYVEDIDRILGPCPGPGYSIDRIDNESGYSPTNVRWATPQVQSWNTRWVRMVDQPDGSRVPMSEACRRSGVNYNTATSRVRRGLSLADAMGPKRGKREPFSTDPWASNATFRLHHEKWLAEVTVYDSDDPHPDLIRPSVPLTRSLAQS